MHQASLTCVLITFFVILYSGTNGMDYLLYKDILKMSSYNSTTLTIKFKIQITLVVSYVQIALRAVLLLKIIFYLPWNAYMSRFMRESSARVSWASLRAPHHIKVRKTSAEMKRRKPCHEDNGDNELGDSDDGSCMTDSSSKLVENEDDEGEEGMCQEQQQQCLRTGRRVKFCTIVKVLTLNSRWHDDQINARRIIPHSRRRIVLNKLRIVLLPSACLIILRIFPCVVMNYINIVNPSQNANFAALDSITPIFASILCSMYPKYKYDRFNLTKFLLIFAFTIGTFISSVNWKNLQAILGILVVLSSAGNALYAVAFRNIFNNLPLIYQDTCLFMSLPSVVLSLLTLPAFIWAYNDVKTFFDGHTIAALLIISITVYVIAEYAWLTSILVSSPVISALAMALTPAFHDLLIPFNFSVDDKVPIPAARKICGYVLTIMLLCPILYVNLQTHKDPLRAFIHNINAFVTDVNNKSTSTSNLELSSVCSNGEEGVSSTFSRLDGVKVG